MGTHVWSGGSCDYSDLVGKLTEKVHFARTGLRLAEGAAAHPPGQSVPGRGSTGPGPKALRSEGSSDWRGAGWLPRSEQGRKGAGSGRGLGR